MPELPEITILAQQMNKEIVSKRIDAIEARQPKNLNIPVKDFEKGVLGRTISQVTNRGKWIFINLDQSYFMLVNLGMGAEILYFQVNQKLPEKYHFKIIFSDCTGFTILFWWFGYVHLVQGSDMEKHKMTAQLGISPTEKVFTLGHFRELLANKKTGVKSFLMDQKNVAGIGNVYIQDILFRARLHPNQKISYLSEEKTHELYKSILITLRQSIKLKGLAYERDFYGHKGNFTSNEFLVGYKEGKPCPVCGTIIEKIRTGSTSTYICPKCQVIKM
jgi:formamidopyrimidine-DNA glycosylase